MFYDLSLFSIGFGGGCFVLGIEIVIVISGLV